MACTTNRPLPSCAPSCLHFPVVSTVVLLSIAIPAAGSTRWRMVSHSTGRDTNQRSIILSLIFATAPHSADV